MWVFLIISLFTISDIYQEKPLLLLNATAVLNNEEQIDNSAIIVEGENFVLVADATMIKLNLDQYEVINLQGKYIYPISMIKKKHHLKFRSSSSTIREGEEASFAILDAPIEMKGSIERIFVKGQIQE